MFLLPLLVACTTPDAPPPPAAEVPAELPSPPFVLPEGPPRGWDAWQTAKIPPQQLEETAARYAGEGKWANAALALYQHLKSANNPKGRYNLACYLAQSGDVEGAVYWLQEASHTEGVDPDWAAQDPTLIPVHKDARWPELHRHLVASAAWWAVHAPPATKVFVPKGSDPALPQPVAVLLHGAAAEPANIFGAVAPAAWSHPIAMIAPSGTRPRGPRTWSWAESPADDHARVQAALASEKGQLTADPARVALVGFAQGGLVALDLLSAHPEAYSGAVVFSAGGTSLGAYDEASSRLDGKHLVVVVGAGEDPRFVQAAERAARNFERRGATVLHRVTAGQHQQALPTDFYANFKPWMDFAFGGPKP